MILGRYHALNTLETLWMVRFQICTKTYDFDQKFAQFWRFGGVGSGWVQKYPGNRLESDILDCSRNLSKFHWKICEESQKTVKAEGGYIPLTRDCSEGGLWTWTLHTTLLAWFGPILQNRKPPDTSKLEGFQIWQVSLKIGRQNRISLYKITMGFGKKCSQNTKISDFSKE